ncbi:lasso peptide biosynthesis B2 protein [Aquidulcibacter paucihalophilus]|uniref:lasso peptide biosynthesis B2 protein n=1 Tax=Aquidulcibacter paucihalophilus TaxID=1978549 RepID=UPI000A18EE9F|nr:lasso peptide biosynthesis B2 protein [Aquidulcibacter paucihalophilus]
MRLTLATAAMLVRAIWLVAIVRLGLTFFGYNRVIKFLKVRPVRQSILSIGRILKCVRWASNVIPKASCLTQSIAGKHLLMCRGHSAEIRVGVAKDANKGLIAHAWLVKDGEVIFGATKKELEKYIPLADFG